MWCQRALFRIIVPVVTVRSVCAILVMSRASLLIERTKTLLHVLCCTVLVSSDYLRLRSRLSNICLEEECIFLTLFVILYSKPPGTFDANRCGYNYNECKSAIQTVKASFLQLRHIFDEECLDIRASSLSNERKRNSLEIEFRSQTNHLHCLPFLTFDLFAVLYFVEGAKVLRDPC
ncbi:hypothetical protein BDF20DRAFT_833147 [Mycotypha africana]|uniref:uncharacterized protein n=1 Tax=Mycotypha africana TaxID=64632 RepID=UPI0022FFE892|nr:uncharacterized protein BDF20DRAFT_833147 [Mycotypha africana]KAI8988279.1 hypothetical protein BDF20DRAFT_833147 [Mycotypha africana]